MRTSLKFYATIRFLILLQLKQGLAAKASTRLEMPYFFCFLRNEKIFAISFLGHLLQLRIPF